MRFDYQPPAAQIKAFGQRRFLKFYLVFIGLGCIVLAFLIRSTENSTKHSSFENSHASRIPLLIAKQHNKPVLSLNSANETTHLSAAELIKDSWRTITVQMGDTISNLFERLGISSTTINHIMTTGLDKSELYNIYPGQKLDFLLDDSKELQALKLTLSNTKTLHVKKTEQGFKYYYEEKKPTKRINFSSAKISGSLYSTAQSVGLNDKLIMQMADIFGCEIDFSLDIRDNDSFKVLYEEDYILDKKIDTGKILAVEFNNQGKLYKAIRYTDSKGYSGYYSPEGYSLQKAFLRSPVEFTRISSHFSNARRHPILHKIRSHKGVDYAAPTGTPVKSAADGRISFIGNKGGYGKSIEITHGEKYSTFYAHLSRFGKKLKHGSTVKQGEIIGYVGKTGLATGAHLHYEFRINGIHHNPVTVSLPRSHGLDIKQKSEFSKHADAILNQLESHAKIAHLD
mgnify:CR=1